MTRVIDIDGDWGALGRSTPIGRLLVDRTRGKENFCFSYHEQWLQSSQCRSLDPELQFFAGPQYPSDVQRDNFGLFLDSLSLELAHQVAEFFRVATAAAKEISQQVIDDVSEWPRIDSELGIRKSEQSKMKAAFRLSD